MLLWINRCFSIAYGEWAKRGIRSRFGLGKVIQAHESCRRLVRLATLYRVEMGSHEIDRRRLLPTSGRILVRGSVRCQRYNNGLLATLLISPISCAACQTLFLGK